MRAQRGLVLTLWRARWNALRLAVAASLLVVVVSDHGARLARLELAALPDFDAAAEVARLRGEGRFGEALMVADGALSDAPAGSAKAAALARARETTVQEQAGWARRLKDAGVGALTGGHGQGSMSLEMVVGAVAADMFVLGDVRDLAIQGWRLVREGEADPVIVALSVVGLVTTLAPEVDWAPAVLKVARRLGSLGEGLTSAITRAAKARDARALKSIVEDTAALAKGASPGGAVRMLKLAEGPEDLARMARFIEKTGPRGAAALHVTGEGGTAVLRSADELRAAGRAAEAARAEALVLRAAAKGPAGAAWLKRGTGRALVRPHWLTGAVKGVYKGNAALLVERILDRLGPDAWWVCGLLAAWTVLESGLLLRRFIPARAHGAVRVPGGVRRAAA